MKKWWQGLKLNTKFTIIIAMLVWIPMVAFSFFFFRTMQKNLIQARNSSLSYEMKENYDRIVKNVESINMSLQFFANDQPLLDFLEAVKQNKEMDTNQLREFYREDIASLERLVNNNLYLYQVRVYAPSDTMQEMMPILYRQSRMERLPWAMQEESAWEGWHFDYEDTLFDSFVMDQSRKIMSYVKGLEAYGAGNIGTIEVAMRMDTMFPHLYDATQTQWCSFLDESGGLYLGNGDNEERKELLLAVLEEEKRQEEDGSFVTEWEVENSSARIRQITLNGRPLLVGILPVKELNGTWIQVYDLSGEMESIWNQRNLFIMIMLAFLLLLTLFINQVVKGVLSQFYNILFSIRKVQKGNLDVVIEAGDSGEMSELGEQINKMLARIRQLMEDNINREVLAKNAEIKALQNQINAHFIYNVLESIKMMAEIDEEYEISDAITKLGMLLRYSMRWVSGNVTVREELEYIRNYLALINLRFDYEIYLSENLPDVILMQEIPKMTLQPIVENAIHHGIEQMAEDTNIYIKGMVEGSDCIIEVTDAGNGMSGEKLEAVRRKIAGEVDTSPEKGHGIGLKNVQDRIRLSFGEPYGIEIASQPGCYTKVSMRIPLSCNGGLEKKDVQGE